MKTPDMFVSCKRFKCSPIKDEHGNGEYRAEFLSGTTKLSFEYLPNERLAIYVWEKQPPSTIEFMEELFHTTFVLIQRKDRP